MAGGSPDDKRVGDATLQRIDDLASGWSVPRRARREEETPPAEERPPEAKAGGSSAAAGEKTKGVKKKKRLARKTKARGKERGKSTAAGRRPAESSLPRFRRALARSEQPPQAPPAAARPELARPEPARPEPARPRPARPEPDAAEDGRRESRRQPTWSESRPPPGRCRRPARIVTEMFDRAPPG